MVKIQDVIDNLENYKDPHPQEKELLEFYWKRLEECMTDLSIKSVDITYIGHVQKNNNKAARQIKALETRIRIQENKPIRYQEQAKKKIARYESKINKLIWLIENTADYAKEKVK